jgi:WD repeat-containing protein 89
MKTYRQTAISNLPIEKDSYVYSISSTIEPDNIKYDTCRPLSSNDRLFAVSSDNSLLILSPETLSVVPGGHFRNVNSSVTTAKRFSGNEVLTAGRDGKIAFYDLRQGETRSLSTPQGTEDPISALASNAGSFYIAAGTELENDGPGRVNVFVWDLRKPSEVLRTYSESHTDTITELQFLPYPAGGSRTLLSGSTDGLVNVFDLTQEEEDDAILQVINHRSATHHTGLIGDDIYALGTDETLSFYVQQSPEEDFQEPDPYALGDIRERLSCEYAIKIWNDNTPLLAVGIHSENPAMKLIPLIRSTDSASPKWVPTIDSRIELAGGHGEDIIRDYYVDTDARVIYTCGEDGTIRQWRDHEIQDVEMGGSTPVKRKGEKLHSSEKRKKP